jgi:hypothetical protein
MRDHNHRGDDRMSGPLGSLTRSLLAVLTAAHLGVSVLSAEIPDWIETETSRRTGTPTWWPRTGR